MIATKPRIGKRLVRATSIGTPPTLPAGFTGWSLDAQNGLSLYKNGVLIGRFGPGGASGILQAYGGYQPVDSTHNARLPFEIPADVQSFSKVALSFSLQPFRATQQTASGAGSLHHHTVDTTHQHRQAAWDGTVTDDVTQFKTWNVFASGYGYVGMRLPNDGNVVLPGKDLLTDNTGGVSSTSGNEGAHTHSLNAPSGLYDTGCPQGCHVAIDGTDRTTALTRPWGSGTALDVSDLDITQWITTTGCHEIQVSSSTLGVVVIQVSMKVYTATV